MLRATRETNNYYAQPPKFIITPEVKFQESFMEKREAVLEYLYYLIHTCDMTYEQQLKQFRLKFRRHVVQSIVKDEAMPV
jgi:hypothetical protein